MKTTARLAREKKGNGMDLNRKQWNENQQALRRALSRPGDHRQAIALCLAQHAAVHAAGLADTEVYSFDEQAWRDLSEQTARRISPKSGHSIVWMIWHIARIEDLTMNLLLADRDPVLEAGYWMEKMNISARDTGNAMNEGQVAALSAEMDLKALRAYRQAVGQRTRENVGKLQPDQLKARVNPARLRRLKQSGAVPAGAEWLLDYWGGLTVAGLLLMPPTRHNFVHLNEVLKEKTRR